MNLTFTPRGWADYLWLQDNEPKLMRKLHRLVYAVDPETITILSCRHHYDQ